MERVTDAERLAALLDGRLDERERAELLAHLGDTGEDLDVLADAAAVTLELEEEDRAAGVVPITSRRRTGRPWVPWRWVAPAAAAALLLALAPRAWRVLRGGEPSAPVAMVALLADTAWAQPAGWEARPWADSRGPSAGLGKTAASVRFGALSVALELAARARDTAAVRLAATEVAKVLRSQSNLVGARGYEAIAARNPVDLDHLAQLERRTAEKLHEPALGLGAWAQAARVAVRAKDAAFFQKPASLAYLDGTSPGLWPEARTALAPVRGAARGGVVDWAQMEPALFKLLETLG